MLICCMTLSVVRSIKIAVTVPLCRKHCVRIHTAIYTVPCIS